MNIAGFAIDDPALAAQFAGWAEQGGGRYFSAGDQQGLSDALREALQVPYGVHDAAGGKVAEGVVGGEPVLLERGTDEVLFATTPPGVSGGCSAQRSASQDEN